VTFAFLPADMVGQILNFGLPAPIDVQVVGNDLEGNRRYADALLAKSEIRSGTADLRIQQPFDEPYLRLRVERTKAEELGFTAHDIAQNLLVSLSGSFQTSPTFWVDPKNHVSYQIATQTPQYRADSLQESGEHSCHRNGSQCSSIAHGQSGIHATGSRHGSSFSLQRSAGD
jgi:multidrug efflux pump subunit AcrB